MDSTLRFIGTVHSTLKRLEDCPMLENENAPAAAIEIFGEYTEGIKDVKSGDEILLFTWLHLADRSVLSTHPRNDLSNPLTGVFSTRSPDRPNPIGIHKVKVIALAGDRIVVSGLEVLDQTPVIDVKPALRAGAGR
jgi:tRNA-Thr(GGU) m(6)t(6)A37 methyltransferase TsaA